MKMQLSAGIAVMALVVGASPAAAVVDEDGQGRLSRGEVKDLLDWNNREFEDNVDSLHVVLDTYSVWNKGYTCTDPETGEFYDWWATQYTWTAGVLDVEPVTTKKGKVRAVDLDGFEREPVVFVEQDGYGGDINDPLPTECSDGWDLSVTDETTTTTRVAVNGQVVGSDPLETIDVTDYANTVMSSIGWNYRDFSVEESADGELLVSTGGEISEEYQAAFLADYLWLQPGVEVIFTNPA